jgi:hypothetical protein
MAPWTCLCLGVFLCLIHCSQGKDVKVEFVGNDTAVEFEVYVESKLWFRSGDLGIYNDGKWWSQEHSNEYLLRKAGSEELTGSDSIGDYSGVR